MEQEGDSHNLCGDTMAARLVRYRMSPGGVSQGIQLLKLGLGTTWSWELEAGEQGWMWDRGSECL